MEDKYIGVCKVGERGQIVIPKNARDMFNISSGDSLVILCDKNKGIALIKADEFSDITENILRKDK